MMNDEGGGRVDGHTGHECENAETQDQKMIHHSSLITHHSSLPMREADELTAILVTSVKTLKHRIRK
jgi:hypothetical protein